MLVERILSDEVFFDIFSRIFDILFLRPIHKRYAMKAIPQGIRLFAIRGAMFVNILIVSEIL